MNGDQSTINTGGESSAPQQIGGLISTTEFATPNPVKTDADPEGANNTQGEPASFDPNTQDKDGQEAAAGDDDKSGGDDEKLDRFDKHPRFQELRAKTEAAEKRADALEAKFNKLVNTPSRKNADTPPADLPYKDTSKMTTEELLDWQSEDPHAFQANILAQAKFELSQDFDQKLSAREAEDQVVSQYEAFAADNPDFDKMWDSGEIEAYIDKHPVHNAISAYMILSQEARIQAAVDKATKEAETKFVKNARAKRTNQSLGAGPQTTGAPKGPVDAELADTKKFGGANRVMANRLRAMRQRQAGL